MRTRTKIAAVTWIALGNVASWAQTPAPADTAQQPQQIERVTVTGSAIKRVDAETAVPITVIKMDDLKKSGVTSVEQIMANLTAVQQSTNTTVSSVGASGGGASFANLRGIGPDKTLILLNGQRIANNAVDGSAPDLNMIPFAGIERVEVLRDGASALYGTDAIGGVINFITKKDYQGATVTLGDDQPRHPGGVSSNANAGFGLGDLDKQGFNVFGFVSYKHQGNINGSERPFGARIAGGLSNSTSPANYTQNLNTLYNPIAPGCAAANTIAVSATNCKLITPVYIDFVPQTEIASEMLKGTLRVDEDLNLGLELFNSQSRVTTLIAPVPYGGDYQNPVMPNGQPNPYFPTTLFPSTAVINPTFVNGSVGAPAFNASSAFPNPVKVQPGFDYVLWRDYPNGPRGQENKNTQNRILLNADGTAAGWDYSVAAVFNRSRVDQYLISGYANGDIVGEGLLEGVINPFGAQSAAGTALLQSAAATGLLQTATGVVQDLNGHASRDVGDWFGVGRPAQLALGLEGRHEKFVSMPIFNLAAETKVSTGVSPTFYKAGSRKVEALYSELAVPVLKTLDLTAAVRYDKYSDFGSTVNPKVSFRFQPRQAILLRGSASTGFRAPTLYELYGNSAFTNTAGDQNNPVNCPNGVLENGAGKGSNCGVQFQILKSGNQKLLPEKSKSGTLGLVVEPLTNLNVGIDFWWIRIRQSIGSIPQAALFAPSNYSQLQQYFHYSQPGNLLSIISNCPGPNCGYADETLQNLGGIVTNGVDLSALYKLRSSAGMFDFSLNSTYVAKYLRQDFANEAWIQNVGTYAGAGPVFRWQHNLSVNWSLAAFGAGAVAHYKTGYVDENPSNRVAPYATTDLYGSYSFRKNLTFVLGVRNLFDRNPPYTNQSDLFQEGGWDPRYADPTGRAYYVRATYNH